jgi:uncharacterized protein
MLLDLSRFRGDAEHVERHDGPDAFSLGDEDFRLTGPVDFSADVLRDGPRFRVVGRLEARLECDCSRCLEPFAVPVDARFDLRYHPATESSAAHGERELNDADIGVSYYRDETIDLGDLMREQFYLAMPMKPLCREDCSGLCPVCGINRNRGTCTCENTWTDPRLNALRKLREPQ